jgi:hypothetical protein
VLLTSGYGINIDCLPLGKRQSIGPAAIERERLHLKQLLEYPENFFLLNDADSMCVSPKLPDFLYDEPDVLWSCLMYLSLPNERAQMQPNHPFITPHPPYFMSRRTIQALLDQPYTVNNRYEGFIDHWMGAAAVTGGLVLKGYPNCYSGPISTHENYFEDAYVGARHRGTVFFHSVKAPQFWQPLVEAHKKYLDDYRPAGDHRPRAEFNTMPDMKPGSYVKITGTDDQLTYYRPGEEPKPTVIIQPPRPSAPQRTPRRPLLIRRGGPRA